MTNELPSVAKTVAFAFSYFLGAVIFTFLTAGNIFTVATVFGGFSYLVGALDVRWQWIKSLKE